MLDPCCGGSLQRGTKIISIIDMVLRSIVLVVALIALIGVLSWDKEEREKEGESKVHVAIALTIVLIAISALYLSLAVLLYKASNERGLKKCLVWYWITLFLFVFDLISTIVQLSAGSVNPASMSFSWIGLIYRVYTLYVVYCFIGELRETG